MPTIIQYAIGFLLVAHGWVHVVYSASSNGWFGPGEGWGWNGHSWLPSGLLGADRLLGIATPLFLLAALGLGAGAVGYLLAADWWVPVLAGSAVLSALLYVVTWDGKGTGLFEKGALGVLVDVVVLAWLFA